MAENGAGALPPEPVRAMIDGSPCWCVSKDEPHVGWIHAPFCQRLREHPVRGLYARLAAEYRKRPIVKDCTGGVPGDRFPL